MKTLFKVIQFIHPEVNDQETKLHPTDKSKQLSIHITIKRQVGKNLHINSVYILFLHFHICLNLAALIRAKYFKYLR